MADISTPNLDYNDMLEAWDINDALMGGTLEMRRCGTKYLPKWQAEDDDGYKKRLSNATLLPVYEETINNNVGRVFAEPLSLSTDTPPQIIELVKNIDAEGGRLDVWGQHFFNLALQYGLAHALVEYPRVNENAKTKAEEKNSGARPYVVLINPRQVIGWKSKVIDGVERLISLRIKEIVTENNENYGQKRVEQIREVIPNKVKIHRKNDNTGDWIVVDEWETSRSDIPLVTLYTKKTGFMRGRPPLLDLGLLAIKHWQSQSEQDNILHVARIPILVSYGLREGQSLSVGASSAVNFKNRDEGGVEYVEHTGAAIGAGKESLLDLEQQMRQAGGKLLRSENTSTKAIEQVTEEKMQENSPLFTMANSLEDALDNILQIIAEWLGLETGGSVDVRTEIEVSGKQFNPHAVLAIQSLRQSGDIRWIDAVKKLQQLGIIDPDEHVDKVISQLESEDPNLRGLSEYNPEQHDPDSVDDRKGENRD